MAESTPTDNSSGRRQHLVIGIVLAALVLWTYRSSLALLAHRWWNEPECVHGFLVPIFSVWFLWVRREMIRLTTGVVGRWAIVCSLILFAVCGAMRWTSAFLFFDLLDCMSLIPCLAAVVLFVGGWQALRWAGPSIAFLFFMVPLPGFVAGQLSHPLQRAGTLVSTYLLQLIGIPCFSQGNVINLAEAQLGVVEACSGLRMMMLFFAVCFGAAVLMKSSPLEKAIVVLSAAPIALAANVIRITVTGILHEVVGHGVADAVFHDLAGWLMMPLAVVLLWTELALLSRLFVDPEPTRPISLRLSGAKPSR